MEKGKFYAVGIGPGDPELLTLKAVRIIEEADVIAVPKSGADVNIAIEITRDFIQGKNIVEFDMPMTKDREKLDMYHRKSAEEIGQMLDDGKSVAFLTLGDPTIYSTVMYVHRYLTQMGYETAVINGITSFCAAAASLNVSLCEREESLHIIPATFKMEDALRLDGTKVLMKSGKRIMEVKEALLGRNAMMVERATMTGEKVYKDLQDLEEPSSYFSLVVVHEEDRR